MGGGLLRRDSDEQTPSPPLIHRGPGPKKTCAMRYDEPRLVWTSLPITVTHSVVVNARERDIIV